MLFIVALMMMVAVYAILGSFVLAAVPKLRVTALNLVVFIFAAYFGSLTIPIIPYGPFTIFNWPAALLAGTVAVFLKTLLVKAPAGSRWL